LLLPCLGNLQTCDPRASTSRVAGITGMNHHNKLCFYIYIILFTFIVGVWSQSQAYGKELW
jgi:hypothetical protein